MLDAAFRRAYRATPHGADRRDRSRRRAQLKIIRSTAVVLRHLRLARAPFTRPGPTEFARRLVDQRFGAGTLDRSLRRVGRAEERIRGLSRDEQLALRGALTAEEFAESVRRTYGRLASFVREVDGDLVRLREIGHYLDGRPRLDPATPSIAIAGFPNVGKSSLVTRLSSAHPKVADYPFTTTAIAVGHTDLGFDRLQVVDTPGVLGRATRHNPAEVEAETAVGHGVDAVVFVLDPSETCGYSLVDQERLLGRWKSEFPRLTIIEVETKSDLGRGGPSRLQVSAKTGDGVEKLRSEIGSFLRQRATSGALPPMEEPTVEPEAPVESLEKSTGRATRRSRRG